MPDLEYDVVVVGAGPAGSMAARYAAQGGAKTLLIEKRQEIGTPVRCAEGVAIRWFEEVGIEFDQSWVATRVEGARLFSPNGTELRIDERMAGDEVGTVLERNLFDKAMANYAAKAGAKIMLRTSAIGVLKEGGKVTGVKVNSMGEKFNVKAKLVIGADGFESQVARWGGIDTNIKQKDITATLQYRLTGIKPNVSYCDFYVGNCYAPGGYIWVFPKNEDSANVGIGMQLAKVKDKGDVKRYLDKFIETHDYVKGGQMVEMVSGGVSICAPLDCVTADGLMLTGDAARMIDPITGGGIRNGCVAGMYAGQVAAEAIKANDTGKDFLAKYEKLWRANLEEKLWRNWMAKEKLVTLTDDVFDKIIGTVAQVGVDQLSTLNILKVIKEKHPELVTEFEDFIG